MKKILVIISLLFLPMLSYTQSNSLASPEPYFSALIVDDIDVSIDWYSKYLGLKLLNKNEFGDSGFKQANLKRGNILIELIELSNAIYPETVIPDYTNKTRLLGYFKIGFLISEFDEWMLHLTKLKVDFHGSVVVNDLTGRRMVIIKDPDGNRIQIFEK